MDGPTISSASSYLSLVYSLEYLCVHYMVLWRREFYTNAGRFVVSFSLQFVSVFAGLLVRFLVMNFHKRIGNRLRVKLEYI